MDDDIWIVTMYATTHFLDIFVAVHQDAFLILSFIPEKENFNYSLTLKLADMIQIEGTKNGFSSSLILKIIKNLSLVYPKNFFQEKLKI